MSCHRTRLPPLPRHWTTSVKSAVLHVISLGQFATAYTRGWAANSPNARIRLAAEVERLKTELALRDEQERIKDTRMKRIPPHRRPNYPPTERMAVLDKTEHSGSDFQQQTSGSARLVSFDIMASRGCSLDPISVRQAFYPSPRPDGGHFYERVGNDSAPISYAARSRRALGLSRGSGSRRQHSLRSPRSAPNGNGYIARYERGRDGAVLPRVRQ